MAVSNTTVAADRNQVEALIDAANSILDATPDPLWWNMTPREVVEFAFPAWETIDGVENDNYNRCTTGMPRVLLRDRNDANHWLLIWAAGKELLPGRMSTMGQFFRFNAHRNQFALGTPEQIITKAARRYHVDARRDLCWWLFQTFAHHYPTPVPDLMPDLAVEHSLWAAFRAANRHIATAVNAGGLPDETADILNLAFPEWNLIGLTEDANQHPLALLRHKDTPDQWMLLKTFTDRLLAPGPDGFPVLFSSTEGHPHTRGIITRVDDLLGQASNDILSWPSAAAELCWLLTQVERTEPGYDLRPYQDQLAQATLMALKATPLTDPVCTDLRRVATHHAPN